MKNRHTPRKLFPIKDLMGAIDPKLLPQAQRALIGMWAQHEGRGLPGVTHNLLQAVSAERQRVESMPQRDISAQMHLDELSAWSQGLGAIRTAMERLDGALDAAKTQSSIQKPNTTHPLSGHGFTSNAIYSASWNVLTGPRRHEPVDEELRAEYRRLQWWWIRVQSRLIEDSQIGWDDYIGRELPNVASRDDQVTSVDRLKALTDISFDAVGLAIRRMSFARHNDLLPVVAGCCRDDLDHGLRALIKLAVHLERWRSPDAGIQSERQIIIDSLRRLAEKVLDPRRRRRRHGDGGGGGGGSRGGELTDDVGGAHVAVRRRAIYVAPPDDLPEFDEWIRHEEVVAFDEEELASDEGVESPRHTGLKLVEPDDMKGHLGRAKAQSHHLAMIRQGFAWDHNSLSDADRLALKALVHEVCTGAGTLDPHEWWPKAMVAVAWVCGRPLEEVASLTYLNSGDLQKAEDDLFGFGQIKGACYWRWPLRQPNPNQVNPFTDALPRIDHVLIPDTTGLVEVLIRAHRKRAVSRTQVFGWLQKPEHRLIHANAVATGLKSEALDRAITPTLLARDLRITLLNLSPDKTVAWMLAGAPGDAREPRMFYAAHTPDDLVAWVGRAHERMGIRNGDTRRPPSSVSQSWPMRYAGAKFLPKIDQVRSLVWRAREAARQFPPLDLLRQKLYVAPRVVTRLATQPAEGQGEAHERADTASLSWTDVRRWRHWHDDVVFWVWMVQALQTSQRATSYPVSLYQQWLLDPDRKWISLEDKRTADRDESRAGVITPLLSSAFALLLHVQAAYSVRWASGSPQSRNARSTLKSFTDSAMPFGFVVFDGAIRPSELTPRWIQSHLKSRFGLYWPVNFNRATLRRALSQSGMNGDGLDAFLGHGALADRIHDRHSLFHVGQHHKNLHAALKLLANQIGLKRLDFPVKLRTTDSRLAKHKRTALNRFAQRSKAERSSVRTSRSSTTIDSVGQDFVRWQGFVSRQLGRDADERSLGDLKAWHARLLTTKLAFAQYVLGFPCDLTVALGAHSPTMLDALCDKHLKAAHTLEAEVVDWVSRGEMSRSIAAHGLNLSYLLCKSMDSRMPTMRVAMTLSARVSSFTTERVGRAVKMDRYRENCLEVLRSPVGDSCVIRSPSGDVTSEQTAQLFDEEQARVKLALSMFLNSPASTDRWSAVVQAVLDSAVPKRHVFDMPFAFVVKGHDKRTRECRGLLDVVSTHVRPLPALTGEVPARMRDLYRLLRPKSAKVAADLGQWVQGIRWFIHMYLPPLVAAHLEGTLHDQSTQGPLANALGWDEATAPNKPRKRKHSALDADASVQLVMPPLWLDDEDRSAPHGWVSGLADVNTPAAAWLRSFMHVELGEPNSNFAAEDLSDALMEAYDAAPAQYRRGVRRLVSQLLAHHGLDAYNHISDKADQVDRHVLDFATYDQLLNALAVNCVTSRRPERQTHLRLLIVLAFRFGFRRREILFLRVGDIELTGHGRIHIRPYRGHTLKTGFSRRSVPIRPLLNEQEYQWLAEAVQRSRASYPDGAQTTLLIPQREHDTLTREAIALLRRVGRDDRLKLHHLRHSFASWMALKIVFARRPEWSEVFAGHPEIHREMLTSAALVGTVLKPELSAGDFLVVPRMLGHSSYEVSLTNYVHTMDIVASLFTGHDLAHAIVPRRDLVHLVNRRYESAVDMRKASLAGQPRSASENGGSAKAVAVPLPWSARVKGALLDIKKSGPAALSNNDVPDPLRLSDQQIQNWLSPRHASCLRDRLLYGVDRLHPKDISTLVQLGMSYWRDDPPMFWLSQLQKKALRGNAVGESVALASDSVPASTQESLGDLLRILQRMGLTDEEVFFWRYSRASAKDHARAWVTLIEAHGYKLNCGLLGGSATTTLVLGVSLGSNSAKRSPLPAVLWKMLAQC